VDDARRGGQEKLGNQRNEAVFSPPFSVDQPSLALH